MQFVSIVAMKLIRDYLYTWWERKKVLGKENETN